MRCLVGTSPGIAHGELPSREENHLAARRRPVRLQSDLIGLLRPLSHAGRENIDKRQQMDRRFSEEFHFL